MLQQLFMYGESKHFHSTNIWDIDAKSEARCMVFAVTLIAIAYIFSHWLQYTELKSLALPNPLYKWFPSSKYRAYCSAFYVYVHVIPLHEKPQ